MPNPTPSALPVDAIMALIAKVPHEADHGRPGHPAAWCERCALDAQLTALLEAVEEGRKDKIDARRFRWLASQDWWAISRWAGRGVGTNLREVIDAARTPDSTTGDSQ